MSTTLTPNTPSSFAFTGLVNAHLKGTGIIYTGTDFDIPTTFSDSEIGALCCVGLRAYYAHVADAPTALAAPQAALALALAGVEAP